MSKIHFSSLSYFLFLACSSNAVDIGEGEDDSTEPRPLSTDEVDYDEAGVPVLNHGEIYDEEVCLLYEEGRAEYYGHRPAVTTSPSGDFAGTWAGSFEFLEGEPVLLTLQSDGLGTVVFGDPGTEVSDDLSGLLGEPEFAGGYQELRLVPGYPYTTIGVVVEGFTLRFFLEFYEPFETWCSEQEPILNAATCEWKCVEEPVREPPEDPLTQESLEQNARDYFSCSQGEPCPEEALCMLGACNCFPDGCVISQRMVEFELLMQGDVIAGGVTGSGKGSSVRLERL